MTKGEYVDLTLLRINGGVLNNESAVWRVDIISYIPAAVNYVLMMSENIQIKDEGDREMPNEFIACYPVNISMDNDRNVNYITLPVSPIAFRSNRGIRLIMDNCNNSYAPIRETSAGSLHRILKMLGDKGAYWYQGKNRINIYNKPRLASKVYAYIIADVDSYGLDDDLPVPAGMEPDVLNMLYQYFTGERQAPADLKTDQKDLNS